MTVKLTNRECLAAAEALKLLAAERIPISGSLRIRQVMRALSEHLRDAEAERIRLCELHADKGEDGKPIILGAGKEAHYQLAPEGRAAYDADVAELMALTWETPHGIAVEHLGKADLPLAVVLGLGPLLEEAPDG